MTVVQNARVAMIAAGATPVEIEATTVVAPALFLIRPLGVSGGPTRTALVRAAELK
jgi:hypothetical protein